ncbi:MFS transporter [Curvivirga sp.]|uniref:MFS transporter n=1 Tax=Curvivirga sp. TaxID=2856848 RepID=UPI003B59DBA5
MSEMKKLAPVALATGISIIGLGTVIPILPFYAKSMDADAFTAALVFSTFSAAAFFSTPFWGSMSDKIGRKPVMLLSALCTVIAYLWLAHASVLWEIFASRAFAGFTAGWLATSQAFVADVTSQENRAKGMGMLGAAFGIGFTIGPGLGAWSVGSIDNPDFTTPAYIAAAMAALSLVIALIFVKEPERHRDITARMPMRKVLKDSVLARLLGVYFAVSLMFTAIEGTFAFWAADKFGLGPRDVGLYLVFAGVVTAFVQGGIGRIVRKRGEAKVVLLGVGFLFLSFLIMTQITGENGIYFVMGALALAMGLHNPAMQSLFSRLASTQNQGGVMGAAQAATALARVPGPAWAGFVFAHFGADMPYYVGAVVLFFLIFAVLIVTRQATKRIEEAG